MLGFTLPLFILVGAETLVGTLLLCPKPLNQPAIALARSTYTQASGWLVEQQMGLAETS